MKKSSLTGIIDYGVGNVRSVYSAVEKVGGNPVLTSNHEELKGCHRLILPGVGAFAHGMAELHARGLDVLIKDEVQNGKPLLGICLGMQMLTSGSFEFGHTKGLGLVEGLVSQLQPVPGSPSIRLPHVDWKPLLRASGDKDWFFSGVNPEARFYFIHSFGTQENETDVAAWAEYCGIRFAAVIARGNVIGTQFHPEKSGPEGLKMLRNFVTKENIHV